MCTLSRRTMQKRPERLSAVVRRIGLRSGEYTSRGVLSSQNNVSGGGHEWCSERKHTPLQVCFNYHSFTDGIVIHTCSEQISSHRCDICSEQVRITTYVWAITFFSQAPTQYFRGEQPLDLNGATCGAASDYKRPHVFRLKMASGGEWLFMCRDDVSKSNLLALFVLSCVE